VNEIEWWRGSVIYSPCCANAGLTYFKDGTVMCKSCGRRYNITFIADEEDVKEETIVKPRDGP
jgi:uncharacterized Zn finger protein (UPF0148 family)